MKLFDGLDERTGYRKKLQELLDEEIPGGARVGYALGMSLVALLVVEALTGIGLSLIYAPSAQTAWASVNYIQHKVPLGWLVRGIHHWAGDALIVVLVLHMLRVIASGSYKKPRDINFWLGLAAMGIVVAMSLTGMRLIWDQKAFWATKVELNIAATMPVIGSAMSAIVAGGGHLGSLTLTRFHGLHVVVFPALLTGIVLMHLALRRRHGFAASAEPKVERRSKQLAIDGVVALAIVGVVVALAIRGHGAPIDAPADPSSDYPARPEWFPLPLYELRKHFHGKKELIATVVLPGLATAFVVLLPLLDRRGDRSLRGRLPWIGAMIVGLLSTVGLYAKAKRTDARDEKLQKAIVAADERAHKVNMLALKGVPPEGPLMMIARDPEMRGEEIWKKDCATCHTFDGKGGHEGPDLKGWGTAAWVEETMRDPDGPARFAKTPFKGEMPSSTKAPPGKEADFKPMPEADVKAVASFVAGDKNARGKEVFGDACGGCHKLDGKGGEDSDLAPDLTGWGTYRWLHSQISDPARGDTYKPEASDAKHKGHMPSYEKEFGAEVDLIAQYVFWKSLARWPTPAEMAPPAK
ncbi:MAG: cytochrome b N-terminal domain-containing protein [Polyangiales bacterium]